MRGLTEDEAVKATAFFTAAIPLLKKAYVNKKGEQITPKGVHNVFSGLGVQFKRRFPEVDYVSALGELEDAKVIASIRCKGGAQVYLWDDKPESYSGKHSDQSKEIDAAMARLLDS